MHVIAYTTLVALQVMIDLTCHVFPFLNVIELPVLKYGHVPHLSSPHFVIDVCCSIFENLACVRYFLRFLGCRRLITNAVLSSMGFIFSDVSRNFRFSFIHPVIFGLFGLCVITRGSIFLVTGFFWDVRRSSSTSSFFAFSIPLAIIRSG